MKTLFFILACTAMLFGFTPNEKDAFRVMTFNIRFDNPGDSLNAWPHRKDNVVKVIEDYKADFVGTQEGLLHQLEYMDSQLTKYAWFGVGRDDGIKAGEYTAVFYNTERFILQDQNTFWCSQTPEKPGLGWDAACNRTVTWGLFKDQRSGKEFYLLNTHFDHVGLTAKKESSKLILERTAQLSADLPIILTGDFNSMPDSEPYKILVQKNYFKDTFALSKKEPIGPRGTFTGFQFGKISETPIDYIFVKGSVDVLSHTTIDADFDGFYPSDHFPVMAELLIK